MFTDGNMADVHQWVGETCDCLSNPVCSSSRGVVKCNVMCQRPMLKHVVCAWQSPITTDRNYILRMTTFTRNITSIRELWMLSRKEQNSHVFWFRYCIWIYIYIYIYIYMCTQIICLWLMTPNFFLVFVHHPISPPKEPAPSAISESFTGDDCAILPEACGDVCDGNLAFS